MIYKNITSVNAYLERTILQQLLLRMGRFAISVCCRQFPAASTPDNYLAFKVTGRVTNEASFFPSVMPDCVAFNTLNAQMIAPHIR